MKYKIILYIFMATTLIVVLPTLVYAANGGLGCGEGFGPLAKFVCGLSGGPGDTDVVGNKLNDVISVIIGFLTIIAGIWFLIQFILGGFEWINAGGDKARVESAQKKLTNAIIGIFLVVAAYVIVGLVGTILGLKILDPGGLLKDIQIGN